MSTSAGKAARAPWQIWKNRRGEISALRIATIALLLVPFAKVLYDAGDIAGSARPINELIHRSGFWALVVLGLSLAVTPFRHVLRYGKLIDIRRMIGVTAFLLVALHLVLFFADQGYSFANVLKELTKRVYLIIGGLAWIGLAILAATSTDGMVRRIGGMRWRRLHQIVYICVLLGLIHYFQQTKADVSVPTFAASLFGWLLGYRVLAWWTGQATLHTGMVLLLSVVIAILTFFGEAAGIAISFNVSPLRVLEAAFDFDAGIRPGWQVLMAGLAVTVLDFIYARWRGTPNRAHESR